MGKLQGAADVEAAADVCRNVADTNGVAVTAGYLFGVANNAALKLRVDYEGRPVLDVGTVAAAGSVQGDAGALTDPVTYVTAADGTKGVVLPAVSAGLVMVVYSTVATSGLKVYPASGDDINDGSANAAITIEGKSAAIFVGLDSSSWAAIYTADA